MSRPDSRSSHTGKHPALDQYRVNARAGARQQGQALRDLEDLARSPGPPAHLFDAAGNRDFVSISDAIATMGLEARQEPMARELLQQIVDDSRDLLGITKAARAIGIDGPPLKELIRRGVVLHHRQNRELAKAGALPEGTERTWNNRTFVKRGGKWVPKKEGKGAKTEDEAPKQGDQGDQGDQEGPGRDPHPEVRARFRHLQGRAKEVGMRIKGQPTGKHTHDHMDALEAKIKEHEAAHAKYNGDPQTEGKKPAAEEKPATGAPEKPPGAEQVPDASGEASGPQKPSEELPGHDTPPTSAPHQTHALQQQVHDAQAQLLEHEHRAQSAGEKAIVDELKNEAKKITKKPSPQAVRWHQSRVASFLAMLTGAAIGAATGTDVLGAAGAGAVEGKASKVDLQTAEKIPGQQEAEEATGAKKKEKPEPKKKEETEEKEIKKSEVLIDPNTGAIYIQPEITIIKSAKAPSGGGWHPIPRGTKGGMRRKSGRGWDYWYPGDPNPQAHKGREVKLTKEALKKLLDHGNYSLISAGRNPNHPEERHLAEDDPVFVKRHERLKREIIAAGYSYTEVEGHYGGTEKTLVVFHSEHKPRPGKEALIVHHGAGAKTSDYGLIRKIAEKFRQDSVVHSRGGVHELHYTTGPNQGKHHKGTGHEILPTADDYYTKVKTEGGDVTKFTLNLDFAGLFDHERALLKALLPPIPPPPDFGLRVRRPKPVNEHGHRDGLVPGMPLALRSRHAELAAVTVLDGGAFKLGDRVCKSGTELLDAIHGGKGHNSTIRRYFRLGGERRERRPDEDLFTPLRTLLKSRDVLVQRREDGYVLTGAGPLIKAGIPAHMLHREDAMQTAITADVASDLIAELED